MNPQRLATKRLIPGFFRVQKDINIAGRTFDGVGNVALLHAEHYDAGKRHISRADCVNLNNIAEEFCRSMITNQ